MNCVCVLLMASHLSVAELEDMSNIMRVISLKNYCENTRVVIQLLQYQNKVNSLINRTSNELSRKLYSHRKATRTFSWLKALTPKLMSTFTVDTCLTYKSAQRCYQQGDWRNLREYSFEALLFTVMLLLLTFLR